MTKMSLLVLGTAVLAASTSLAQRGPRWADSSSERIRGLTSIQLGEVKLGDRFSGFNSDFIDVRNSPRIECNLSHIKLTALNSRVRIQSVEVKYYNGQTNSIDLTSGEGTESWENSIRLWPQESTRWLDLNDVNEFYDQGKCIDRIRVTGVSRNGRGSGYGGYGNSGDIAIEGLLSRGGRPGRPGYDRPRGDRPGYDRPREDRPGYDRPRHDRPSEPRLDLFQIGALKFTLFKSDNEGFTNTNVTGPVKGLVFDAEGSSVFMKRFSVTCGNGKICYNEEVDDSVSYKIVRFAQPTVVKAITAKGSGGRIKVYVIR